MPGGVFCKIHLDGVNPKPKDGQYPYIIVTWDTLSGWVEAKAVPDLKSKTVTQFIEDYVISCIGGFYQATVDDRPEFHETVSELLKKYGVTHIVSAQYHPEANGRVERGHRPLTNTLVKISKKANVLPQEFPACASRRPDQCLMDDWVLSF